MSGKNKYDTCCKCGKICKFRGGYKKVYPDEPIVVIDKGNHTYCVNCFEDFMKNKSEIKPVYRG